MVNFKQMEQKYYQMSQEEKQRAAETLKTALSSQPEVVFAFIYGSFNDHSIHLPFHDIDVGVYVKEMGKKESVYYSLDLSDKFSTLIKVPVDVRVLNFAPITFCYHVIRGQLIVDKDEDFRSEFMERVIRHYLDMKPLFIRATKEAFGHET
ncbi:MAG: nucleotidyltransferase domain-containing protein [Candidatus Aminicenantes bacterium]|nr:MAG: nucleotidyltransferase domain-containing protein [Candidatus Aminicenantes bacterium]